MEGYPVDKRDGKAFEQIVMMVGMKEQITECENRLYDYLEKLDVKTLNLSDP